MLVDLESFCKAEGSRTSLHSYQPTTQRSRRPRPLSPPSALALSASGNLELRDGAKGCWSRSPSCLAANMSEASHQPGFRSRCRLALLHRGRAPPAPHLVNQGQRRGRAIPAIPAVYASYCRACPSGQTSSSGSNHQSDCSPPPPGPRSTHNGKGPQLGVFF